MIIAADVKYCARMNKFNVKVNYWDLRNRLDKRE
jgi:hypothetical protein